MAKALRLPDFISVGPQRAGTPWLHQVPKRQVRLSRGRKETEYFLNNYSLDIDGMQLNRWHRAIDLFEKVEVWRFCFGRCEEFAPLDPEVDARLRRAFLPEIEDFEKLIRRDLSAWKLPAVGRDTSAG